MLRLNPLGYYRFVQANQFESSYAGGEANVAISLANFGLDAAFVTKVPDHEIGHCAVNAVRQFGVDTSHVSYGGNRLGMYYVEKVPLSVLPKLFMTGRDLQLPRQSQMTFTGMRSFVVQIGSILLVLHQP